MLCHLLLRIAQCYRLVLNSGHLQRSIKIPFLTAASIPAALPAYSPGLYLPYKRALFYCSLFFCSQAVNKLAEVMNQKKEKGRGGVRAVDSEVHKKEKENRKLQLELKAERQNLNSIIFKYQKELDDMQAVSAPTMPKIHPEYILVTRKHLLFWHIKQRCIFFLLVNLFCRAGCRLTLLYLQGR